MRLAPDRHRRGWLARGAILLLAGTAAWASLWPATRSSPVFGDEIGWISASSRTADLLLAGDFRWSRWDMAELGSYGAMNPPVGKAFLGLPLRAGRADTAFAGLWDWSLDEAGNRARGNLPSGDLFLAARRIAAIQAGLLVAAACALGWAVGGLPVGALAAVALCAHPTWREAGPLVLTDMLVTALLVAMSFPVIAYLRKPAGERGLGTLSAAGLLLGLAGAVKPTGLVLGGMFLVAGLVLRAPRFRGAWKALSGGALALAVAGGTLVVLDPWLWPDLRAADRSEIAREWPVAAAALASPQPIAALESRRSEIPSIHALARPAWIAVRAMHWKHLVGHQRSLPALAWPGPRLRVLARWILVDLTAFPGQILLVLVGIGALLRGRIREGRDGLAGKVLVAFAAAALAYVLALVVLPVPRYLMLLLVLLQILSAVGAVACWRGLRSRIAGGLGTRGRLADRPQA